MPPRRRPDTAGGPPAASPASGRHEATPRLSIAVKREARTLAEAKRHMATYRAIILAQRAEIGRLRQELDGDVRSLERCAETLIMLVRATDQLQTRVDELLSEELIKERVQAVVSKLYGPVEGTGRPPRSGH